MKKTFRFFAMAFLSAASLAQAGAQDKSGEQAPVQPGDLQPAEQKAHSESDQDRVTSHPVAVERHPRYLLRPTDVLQINFPISPEYDQSVTVQPDGYINLRSVGDLYVAGKSVPELIEALKKTYQQFLHEPVINVELKDFERPYFIAGGEFGHPGKFELRGDTTVAEAVAIAGGFTDKAKHSEVVLFHRAPNGWAEAKRLDVKQMLANKDLSEDVHLRPGDLIYVPKNTLSKLRQFIPNTGLGMSIP
ncbi:MAG TPA: polysaccharide biosynthesis/export family protein [Candidatus Sulfotelmatobacter sp.]